jgi:hypothetical protein
MLDARRYWTRDEARRQTKLDAMMLDAMMLDA